MAVTLWTTQVGLLLQLLPTDMAAGTRLLRGQSRLHQRRQEHLLEGAEDLDLSGAHLAESMRLSPLVVHGATGGLHLAALTVHTPGLGDFVAHSPFPKKS